MFGDIVIKRRTSIEHNFFPAPERSVGPYTLVYNIVYPILYTIVYLGIRTIIYTTHYTIV